MSTTQTQMKAVTFSEYGDAEVLQLRDNLSIPNINDDEVLVAVKAAALNPFDRYMMTGVPYALRSVIGFTSPRLLGLGQDFAGVVEKVGRNVTQFRVGDRVFGDIDTKFGRRTRALAEYVKADAEHLVHCPDDMSFSEAAGMPMVGRTALLAVREFAKVREGMTVLVYGASGGVGSYITQIAKIFGGLVTAVCGAQNVESVRTLGADNVIDYQQQPIETLTDTFDIVIDCVGNVSMNTWDKRLVKHGRYVQVGSQFRKGFIGPAKTTFEVALACVVNRDKQWQLVEMRRDSEDLHWLLEQVKEKRLKTLVGHTFAINEIQSAMRVIETGHTGGKVIISIDADLALANAS